MQKRYIVVAIILAITVAALYHYADSGTTPHIYTLRPTLAQPNIEDRDGEDIGDYIAIPGFDVIFFRANTLNQRINITNPARNQCYFQIAIIMQDGQEIYKSDLIAPDNTLSDIIINTELSAGKYPNVVLQYTCYSIDTLKIINGANIKLELEVL